MTRSSPRLCSSTLAAMFLLLGLVRRPQGSRAFTTLVSPPRSLGLSGVVPLTPTATRTHTHSLSFRLLASSTATDNDAQSLPDISQMRAGEMKKELESYGISTKSFLEKSELSTALQKARDDGLKPQPKTASSSSTTSASSSSQSTTSSQSSSSTSSSSSPKRTLAEELELCRAMKASELKTELKERGVSTAALFEKSELVEALAKARVEGKTRAPPKSQEGYAEYANVEVLTDDSSGPRPKQSAQQQQQSNQQQAGGNPFGGGGSPFGGGGMPDMGGMGGIADMLKNMGMGGAAGAGGSPFGGAGGNPFGGGGAGGNPFGGVGGGGNPFGNMGKVQEMMQNPKVMELMQKAQGNPKISRIMQEIMSNPAAAAKYQNDPEVRELVQELQKYL